MIDCGLLNAKDCIITFNNTVDTIYFKSYYLKMGIPQIQPTNISMSGFLLTDAGKQLYQITQVSSNLDFVKKIQEQLKNNYSLNFEIKEYKTQEHQ